MKKILILDAQAGERVDLFLSKKFPQFSRGQIQQGIDADEIKIDNKKIKPAHKLKAGEEIAVNLDFLQKEKHPLQISAENIALKILFEDDDIIAVDKPAGIVVHPAPGSESGTLVNALINYDPKIGDSYLDDAAKLRPGIVHRLDKDTSGVLIVAKNSKVLPKLSKQLADKKIKKTYFALAYGETADKGEILSHLGRSSSDRKKITVVGATKGKAAITKYKKIRSYNYKRAVISLLEIIIPTGRTHQIRVQMKSIGHPIIGDQTYFTNESKNLSDQVAAKRQMLHASKIEFYHPISKKRLMIKSELPDDFRSVMQKLS